MKTQHISIGKFSLNTLALGAALGLFIAGCGGGSDASPAAPSSANAVTNAAPNAAPGVGTAPAPVPAAPASTPASSSAITEANSCALPNYLTDLMNAINAARATARSCGSQSYAATTPLAWNDTLLAAAAAHSQDMAQNNYFEHNSQNGTTFDKRITSAGYNWSAAGENIAAGYRTVNDVMQGWLKSEGHCQNIMSPSFKEVGVACAKGATSSAFSSYWTMDLAAPR
jgi:uncharacterized protein YkwD